MDSDAAGNVKRIPHGGVIAVRDATTFRGQDSHSRIAVCSPDETNRLLGALLDE